MNKRPISEAADFINGRAFKPSEWGREGLPIIRIQNLTGTSKVFNCFKGTVSPKNIVKRGDILISWSASLGVYRWTSNNAVLNQHIFKVVLKSGVDSSYFYYVATDALKQMVVQVHGSTMQHITKDKFDAIPISLPSEPEQKRIAGVLEKADRLRSARRYARQLPDTLLQSIFLEMFGDPVTNPYGWEVSELEEQLENIDSGWSPVCDGPRRDPSQWAILGLGSVTCGRYRPEENKQLPAKLAPKPQLEVRRGDVLITRKNTIDLVAACAFVHSTPVRLMLPDTIFRFHLSQSSHVISEYLWSLFSYPSFRKRVQSLATGSAGSMPNISKEKFLEVVLPIPPRPLQRKFAGIVQRFERLRAQQHEAEREAEHLFQTLLHRAFKGEL
jgi:type I restriction enzyme S subunit